MNIFVLVCAVMWVMSGIFIGERMYTRRRKSFYNTDGVNFESRKFFSHPQVLFIITTTTNSTFNMAFVKSLKFLQFTLLLLISLMIFAQSVAALPGTSTHYWDCCMVRICDHLQGTLLTRVEAFMLVAKHSACHQTRPHLWRGRPLVI
jgi:hypothetical protein